MLLRGQQSSRNSQRLTAGVWVTTRVSNTYVCLPKIISTSMQDFASATRNLWWTRKCVRRICRWGRETQEHRAASSVPKRWWKDQCNGRACTTSYSTWVRLFWYFWKTLFEAMPTAKVQPNGISAAISACERVDKGWQL